ncbi:MAG: ester cyclase [Chloroflexi bacterium]|nr:ester cyclase [Chloroflexota bacterium]
MRGDRLTATETRAALARVLQSAAVAGDLSTAIRQHVSPSIVVHMPNGEVGQGQGAVAFLDEGYAAFPDLTLTFESLDDRAAAQFTMEGTHTGPFRGFLPTGKVVHLPICLIARVEAGLIAEIWYYANLYAPLVDTLMPLPDSPPSMSGSAVSGIVDG